MNARLTQLVESLKQEVDSTIAAARRPRERATGRYGFVNRWDRLCQCGHKLGDHTAQAPHDCIAVDFGHGPCGCERFRPAKRAVQEAAGRWAILQPRRTSRAHIDGGGRTVTTWEPSKGMDDFPDRAAAIRAFVVGMDHHLKGADDAFVQRHWAVYVRNGEARVGKLGAQTEAIERLSVPAGTLDVDVAVDRPNPAAYGAAKRQKPLGWASIDRDLFGDYDPEENDAELLVGIARKVGRKVAWSERSWSRDPDGSMSRHFALR